MVEVDETRQDWVSLGRCVAGYDGNWTMLEFEEEDVWGVNWSSKVLWCGMNERVAQSNDWKVEGGNGLEM